MNVIEQEVSAHSDIFSSTDFVSLLCTLELVMLIYCMFNLSYLLSDSSNKPK